MKAGDVIFESRVFSHVLNPEVAFKTCDFCFKKCEPISPTKSSLLRCTNCQDVYYCDKKCQKGAWSVHKEECKFVASCKPNIVPPDSRHLIRTLIKLKKGGAEEYEQLPDGTKRRFSDLFTHEDKIRQDKKKMEAFSLHFMMVKMCFGGNAVKFDDAFRVYCRILINSCEIASKLNGKLGSGLYLGLSALDHSCRPNVNILFAGRAYRVSVMEPMNEPVLPKLRIPYYTEECKTWKERQDHLQKQYYFTCDCSFCEDEKKDEKKASLPCSNCDKHVIIGNSSCDSCKHQIDKALLERYMKWHTAVESTKQKLDMVKGGNGQAMVNETFSAYREGLSIGVKNDHCLLISALNFEISLIKNLEGLPSLIQSSIQPKEIENLCLTILIYHKKRYHRNSELLAWVYLDIGGILRIFKYISKSLNPMELNLEVLRIYELLYTRDSPEYKDIYKNFCSFK